MMASDAALPEADKTAGVQAYTDGADKDIAKVHRRNKHIFFIFKSPYIIF